MKIRTEEFNSIAKKEINNAYARAFLGLLPPIIAMRRVQVMSSFPNPDQALKLSRAIRSESIARLPDLLEEFEQKATKSGAKVLWAKDAQEARKLVLSLIRDRGATFVTKGKSMVTEEIGLNEALEQAQIEPIETDLGEFIAQQLNRPPFHIVGPAINVPVEEIRDLFLREGIMKEDTTDPVQLGYAARIYLRDKFHHIKVGLTGVNMAVAETGTIINVENEGNIRFNKSSPITQISIMTPEKVVPSLRDAMHIIRLLCRSCTGQKISAYVTLDTGPKKAGEIDGPEELYIIIVDNGRSEIYANPRTREVLRCIRCGACLNTCPVYTKIGGYPYGWAYSGPMGQILNPLLLGLDRTQDLYRACTQCGTCRDICPGGIDHPALFLYYRSCDVEGNEKLAGKKRPRSERISFSLWGLAVKNKLLWNTALRLGRFLTKKYSSDGWLTNLGRLFPGWFKERDFPSISDSTFRERWKEMRKGKYGHP
ncbi:MAG: lactate utilization protein [Syntrophales bacterium]|nr:lactate utilization protein [Syntrophales bacterium]